MVKLIACDVDGTLIEKGQGILNVNVENKIKEAIGNGKTFAVISGRDYCSLSRLFGFCTDKIYFVCCGGGVCIKDGKTLYSKPVTAQNVNAALKTADKYKRPLVLCSDKKVYVYGCDRFFGKIEKMYGTDAVRISGTKDVSSPIYKLSFYGDSSVSPIMGEIFGLKLFYNRNGWEEYINRFTDKADAFSDLMLRLGVLASETVCAGDDACDVRMLSKAGKAYALGDEAAKAERAERIYDPTEIFSGI